jgi:hypothetical protein
MKPEPRPVALVPVQDATLERLDSLIEHLLELRNLLDGDPDQELERHDGEATFPDHPLYSASWHGLSDEAPGTPDDAEAEPDEDADADEWSGVIVYDQEGRWRWA